jgi:hypothetical protein
MNTEHNHLVRDAVKAIQAVHEDTSVSLETTLESLESLYDEIHDLVNAVKWNIKNKSDDHAFEP